jgi:hypothetical protein
MDDARAAGSCANEAAVIVRSECITCQTADTEAALGTQKAKMKNRGLKEGEESADHAAAASH